MSGNNEILDFEKFLNVRNSGSVEIYEIPQRKPIITPKALPLSQQTRDKIDAVGAATAVSSCTPENSSIVKPQNLSQSNKPIPGNTFSILSLSDLKNLANSRSDELNQYQLIHLDTGGRYVAMNKMLDNKTISRVSLQNIQQNLNAKETIYLLTLDSNDKLIKSQEIEMSPQGKPIIKDKDEMINTQPCSTRVSPQTYEQSVNLKPGTSAAALATKITPEVITTNKQSGATGVITITPEDTIFKTKSIKISPDGKLMYICTEPGGIAYPNINTGFKARPKPADQSNDKKLLFDEKPGPSGLQKTNKPKVMYIQKDVCEFKVPQIPTAHRQTYPMRTYLKKPVDQQPSTSRKSVLDNSDSKSLCVGGSKYLNKTLEYILQNATTNNNQSELQSEYLNTSGSELKSQIPITTQKSTGLVPAAAGNSGLSERNGNDEEHNKIRKIRLITKNIKTPKTNSAVNENNSDQPIKKARTYKRKRPLDSSDDENDPDYVVNREVRSTKKKPFVGSCKKANVYTR